MFLESNPNISPKWAPKVFINEMFYKEIVFVFQHFFGLRFLTGKVMIHNFAKMQQAIVENVMIWASNLDTFRIMHPKVFIDDMFL